MPDEMTPEVQPSATDVLVDEWFIETFHNLGLDVQLYNRFYAAKDSLKARLAALTATKEAAR